MTVTATVNSRTSTDIHGETGFWQLLLDIPALEKIGSAKITSDLEYAEAVFGMLIKTVRSDRKTELLKFENLKEWGVVSNVLMNLRDGIGLTVAKGWFIDTPKDGKLEVKVKAESRTITYRSQSDLAIIDSENLEVHHDSFQYSNSNIKASPTSLSQGPPPPLPYPNSSPWPSLPSSLVCVSLVAHGGSVSKRRCLWEPGDGDGDGVLVKAVFFDEFDGMVIENLYSMVIVSVRNQLSGMGIGRFDNVTIDNLPLQISLGSFIFRVFAKSAPKNLHAALTTIPIPRNDLWFISNIKTFMKLHPRGERSAGCDGGRRGVWGEREEGYVVEIGILFGMRLWLGEL
ncbi:hypothetical protein F5877DRAFT_66827 [Lentinula edodes]|nr:hypothetical protein F5877DRAFT_66827 [Lentinula edodes]